MLGHPPFFKATALTPWRHNVNFCALQEVINFLEEAHLLYYVYVMRERVTCLGRVSWVTLGQATLGE